MLNTKNSNEDKGNFIKPRPILNYFNAIQICIQFPNFLITKRYEIIYF